MLLFRILGILAVAAVASCIVLYIASGDRKYLRFALNLFKWTLVLALLFFALIILERLTGST